MTPVTLATKMWHPGCCVRCFLEAVSSLPSRQWTYGFCKGLRLAWVYWLGQCAQASCCHGDDNTTTCRHVVVLSYDWQLKAPTIRWKNCWKDEVVTWCGHMMHSA